MYPFSSFEIVYQPSESLGKLNYQEHDREMTIKKF